ncbi:MAG: Crp/Fnr family transcriptional regulator [Bacteroidales bacterium]|nr:Crp/Fnr family transcriptional regulator [Bacteroidales bacterium]
MNKFIDNIDCHHCKLGCVNFMKPSESELDLLLSSKRTICYKKSETIFKQSTFVSHVAFIRSGLVKIFTEGFNDKNIIIQFIAKNNFIGLPFIFNDNYSYYTATALTNTELCLIEKNEFSKLILNNLVLEKYILKLISNDAGILCDKVSSLGTKQLHGCLASAILNLSKGDFRDENIFSHLTKRELAEYAGMSVESLMRLLSELKSDKIIIQKGKEIIINDYNLLEKLSLVG